MHNEKAINVIVDKMSPRLSYTLDFIFIDVLKVDYNLYLVTDIITHVENPIIYYCFDHAGKTGLSIRPIGLLSECSIKDNIESVEVLSDNIIALMDNPENETADIFSFIFFCITRYEEYLTKDFDSLGRFEANKSLAYQKNFLKRALVDECIQWLVKKINLEFPTYHLNPKSSFSIRSTIDIDQIWAYAHKGYRNFFGLIRDFATLNFPQMKMRLNAWNNVDKDPFNTFRLIERLHLKHKTVPKFFMLMALKIGKYDKNHSPNEPNFRKFIKDLSIKYDLGIHPSYGSNDQIAILLQEKKDLESIISHHVTSSRQHYLILHFPTTYHRLLTSNITNDYSMGYADSIGYRASTGHSFYWYDLLNENKTKLKITPFQIMDVTLKNYLKLSPEQAIIECKSMIEYAKKIGSPIHLIWHNNSLYEKGDWKGWVKVYDNILSLNH